MIPLEKSIIPNFVEDMYDVMNMISISFEVINPYDPMFDDQHAETKRQWSVRCSSFIRWVILSLPLLVSTVSLVLTVCICRLRLFLTLMQYDQDNDSG